MGGGVLETHNPWWLQSCPGSIEPGGHHRFMVAMATIDLTQVIEGPTHKGRTLELIFVTGQLKYKPESGGQIHGQVTLLPVPSRCRTERAAK